MPRGGRFLAIGVFAVAASFVAYPQLTATGNIGVVISEIGHGPSLTQQFGVPWPSYIELVNVRAAAGSMIPPPVVLPPVTPQNPNGTTILARVRGAPPTQLPFPQAVTLGSNPQPSPAPPVVTPIPDAPVVVIASGPFPPNALPSTFTNVFFAPAFFSGASAQLGAPGVPFEICVSIPGVNNDRVFFVTPPVSPMCPSTPFALRNNGIVSAGLITRWLYIDSDTDFDFDTQFLPSPGRSNPEMTHANGFIFGNAQAPTAIGAPFQVIGSAAGGTLLQTSNSIVRGVNFLHLVPGQGLINRTIGLGVPGGSFFDPIVGTSITFGLGFVAQTGTSTGTNLPNFLPGLQITGANVILSAVTGPGTTGTLFLPSGAEANVGVTVQPGTAGNFRIERLFSDQVSDTAPSGTGALSVAQADVLPPSTGGGNTWCEVIAYDYAGNQYRAKVRNWPQGGGCGTPPTPLLALGTDGLGTGTLIDVCFDGNSKVFNLFSTTPAATCGGPLFPPGGICPDLTTTLCLSLVGIPPIDVVTDAAGIFAWQSAPGQFASLIGITFEAIGIEYTLVGPTIIKQSPVNSITF